MSKRVAIFTGVLSMAVTAGVLAQQQQRGTGQQGQTFQGDRGTQDQQRFGQQDQWRQQDQQYWGYRDRDMDSGMGTRGQQPWGQDQQRWGQQDQQRWGRDFDDRGMGMRDRQMGRMQDRTGEGQRLAVIGQVINEQANIPGVNPDHQVAQIRTREGTTLFIDLGPTQQAQELNLSQDHSIFARGQLVNVGGHPVLMARDVARVTQRLSIQREGRDQTGRQDQFGQRQQDRGHDDQILGYRDDDHGHEQQEKDARRDPNAQQREGTQPDSNRHEQREGAQQDSAQQNAVQGPAGAGLQNN